MKLCYLLSTLAAFLARCTYLPKTLSPNIEKNQSYLGFNPENFDRRIKPGDDFYHYVNGGWIARTNLPADKAKYWHFDILGENVKNALQDILTDLRSGSLKDEDTERLIALIDSYIDRERRERLGLSPILPILAEIDAIRNVRDLSRFFAKAYYYGIESPIYPTVTTDEKRNNQYSIYLYQAGLSLPDRDYYLDKGKDFDIIRAKYKEHIAHMLKYLRFIDTSHKAEKIFALERDIARIQWSQTELRDAEKTYNYYPIHMLQNLNPQIYWKDYLEDLKLKSDNGVIIVSPSYLRDLHSLINKDLETWKLYFKWQTIHCYASYLTASLDREDFLFFGRILTGQEEQEQDWKRALTLAQENLPDSVARLYVAKSFSKDSKEYIKTMVENIRVSFKDSIEKNEWLSPESKKKALDKLKNFIGKIGYPEKWESYAELKFKKNDLVGNLLQAREHAIKIKFSKLGKEIDRSEWNLPAYMVNASFSQTRNEITFPAAILQPPFFNPAADDAVNYGALGAVIGHEMSHGFDDEGSKYDSNGRLQEWWTQTERAEFNKRAQVLVMQYQQFEPIPGYKVNGKLTLGENIADLCGLTLALKAYNLSLKNKKARLIGGYTGLQRFFIGWAQSWAAKMTKERMIKQVKTNPHAPEIYRVNGVVRNIPEFYTAFSVKSSDKLYLEDAKRVKIW